MEALDNGQVDFLLEVKNVGELGGDEVAQVEMSVGDGPPELVNIIGILSAGESKAFRVRPDAFARNSHAEVLGCGFAYDGQRKCRDGGYCRDSGSDAYQDRQVGAYRHRNARCYFRVGADGHGYGH